MLRLRGPPPSPRRGVVAHTEQLQGSGSISVGSGEQKWGAALGCCLQPRFRLLEKNVGLKQSDGERALCFFCEDHIVMQGKKIMTHVRHGAPSRHS